MYWDNDVTPPLSVSFIRSLSLCCIQCLGWSHQCQVPTFLWSGGANWLPSLPCPGHCWDISDLSQNKSNKVRDRDIAWLIRLDCGAGTDDGVESRTRQLYSDQSWSNDIFTNTGQHFTSFSALQCTMGNLGSPGGHFTRSENKQFCGCYGTLFPGWKGFWFWHF